MCDEDVFLMDRRNDTHTTIDATQTFKQEHNNNTFFCDRSFHCLPMCDSSKHNYRLLNPILFDGHIHHYPTIHKAACAHMPPPTS